MACGTAKRLSSSPASPTRTKAMHATSLPESAPLVQVCVETMMHLTCTNMPVSELENALDKVAPCTYPVPCLALLFCGIRCLLLPGECRAANTCACQPLEEEGSVTPIEISLHLPCQTQPLPKQDCGLMADWQPGCCNLAGEELWHPEYSGAEGRPAKGTGHLHCGGGRLLMRPRFGQVHQVSPARLAPAPM